MDYTAIALIAMVVVLIVARKVRGLLTMVPPPRIHLRPCAPTWAHRRSLSRYTHDLEGRGFVRLGTYRADPIRGIVLTAFAHVPEALCAVVYTHPLVGTFIDFVSKNLTGRSFTVSSARAGKELDQPEGHEKVFDPGMPVARMIETVLQRRPPAPYLAWSAENFAREFEGAYAREMDWRAGRGGVTQDEVRRTADAMGRNVSDRDVLETTRKLQRQYVHSRRDMR